jgi:hypothetical protein
VEIEGLKFKTSSGKKLARSYFKKKNKPGMVAHTYNSSYSGGTDERIADD